MEPIHCQSSDPNVAAVVAEHLQGLGGPAAIIANSEGRGVIGASIEGQGIWGQSVKSTGVVGISTDGHGVQAESTTGTASIGKSDSGIGVHGVAASNSGVLGTSGSGIGVHGATDTGEAAIRGDHHADGFAGVFNGQALVTKDLHVGGNIHLKGDVQLEGADVAEQFEIESVDDLDGVDPGCVMVLMGDDRVRVCDRSYDRRVAGVLSGAGGYRPGLVLDRRSSEGRLPLALVGKAWCKVDADPSPVTVGDLLTTSSTPGHAMRADDPSRAFGAVLGKALADVPAGRSLIPVLVSPQ
ncbi:MAG TPA: hypothetical protein VEX15_06590 [Nocardioidaceae bacterium]|nr:hypothetical protein [Nocardioidaceae bacterium]